MLKSCKSQEVLFQEMCEGPLFKSSFVFLLKGMKIYLVSFAMTVSFPNDFMPQSFRLSGVLSGKICCPGAQLTAWHETANV